jgi:hypothetical protein
VIQTARRIQASPMVGQKIGDTPSQVRIAPGGVFNRKQRLRETAEIVYGFRAF